MVSPDKLVGNKAPMFTLESVSGFVSLKDFFGKKVILYFYPRDNTPGCTLEALDFSSLKAKFSRKNAVVIGVSKDSVVSHEKFVKSKGLKVLLLSDPDSKMQEKYGVWGLKKFMGREFMGTKRTTFLIDEKGVVRKVWENVKAKGHAEEVLSSLS